MKFLFNTLLACLLAASFTAGAALVSVDLQRAGDGLITRDTDTGLEWLDLNKTTDRTYNFVTSQMGAGGIYDGWTYATSAQVETFIGNAGGIGPYTGWSVANDGVVNDLLRQFWGYTEIGTVPRYDPIFGRPVGIQPGEIVANFITADSSTPGKHWLGYLFDNRKYSEGVVADYIELMTYELVDNGTTGGGVSSALIRTSPVPIPAAAWLFGSGLVGLFAIARRKSTT